MTIILFKPLVDIPKKHNVLTDYFHQIYIVYGGNNNKNKFEFIKLFKTPIVVIVYTSSYLYE